MKTEYHIENDLSRYIFKNLKIFCPPWARGRHVRGGERKIKLFSVIVSKSLYDIFTTGFYDRTLGRLVQKIGLDAALD